MGVSWLLLGYAVCGILACGTLGAQGVCVLGGHGTKVSMPATVIALVAALLSGAFAVARLGRVDRFLNVFGNPSSAIAQGYYALVILLVVALVAVVVMRRAETPGELPAWCAVLCAVAALLGIYALAANLTATVHNAAKTWLTAAYVLCAAAAVGAFACAAVEAARSRAVAKGLGLAAVGSCAATGVMAVVYALVAPSLGLRVASLTTSTYGIVPGHPSGTSVSSAAAAPGIESPLFWVVAVAVGACVPLVLGWVTRKTEGAPRAVASALCAVAVLAGAGVTLGMFALGSSATKMFM